MRGVVKWREKLTNWDTDSDLRCVSIWLGHGKKQEMKTCWKGKLKETMEICESQARESKFSSMGNMVPQKFLRRDTIRAF